MSRIFPLLAGLLWASGAFADTGMSIVTTRGYVTFAVADHWPVLETTTKMPSALTVFKVPNPADEGTADATSLILQLFERGSEEEKSLFAAPVKQYGPTPPAPEHFEGWTITRQQDPQGPTTYSLWDARKTGIADVSVRVRLIWPHLSGNPTDHEEQMDRLFGTFLRSIDGGLGPYKPREGETMRRAELPPTLPPASKGK